MSYETQKLDNSELLTHNLKKMRSGTSINAITNEAKRGVSTKDFKNKFGTALKETDETKYWLEILQATEREVPDEMMNKCEELIQNFSFHNHKLITLNS